MALGNINSPLTRSLRRRKTFPLRPFFSLLFFIRSRSSLRFICNFPCGASAVITKGNAEHKCGDLGYIGELLDGNFVVMVRVSVLAEVHFLELNLPVLELEVDFCRLL
jgi:hypothetical protein